ncbi:MAG: DUF2461 domain-containing protein [Bacteroidales bacterium]|nr:DUF2461 domain-containing protein [Bacteroidales bacterium]
MASIDLHCVWNFLSDLALNNNKNWFDAHKSLYKQAHENSMAFAEALITGLAKFDKDVAGLSVKDCTYRIYRDLRFSIDKTPYKKHIGIYVCPQGKKSENAGYYVHIEPSSECMLVSGLYMPSPAALKSVREEIMCEGELFENAIKACEGFELDWSTALKRIPQGWNSADKYSEYYKLKDFNVIQKITKEQILSPDFLEFVLQEFKKTHELNVILNRCVSYAKENY